MVVLKFGGTSVEDAGAIERVCRIVRSRVECESAVVVVSALGGVTDALAQMGKLATSGEIGQAVALARAFTARHLQVTRSLLSRAESTQLGREIIVEFRNLTEVLRGIAAVRELTPRTSDRLLAFGERLSSRIVAAALATRKTESEWIDARDVIVTDDRHMRAIPDFNVTNARLQARLIPLAARGTVAVLGGFIGATHDCVTTTLGRGGSDFTATIVGAAISATRIEIWTDVDGIMTTDPKLCPDARTIPDITFDEAAELAHFGAKVIHPWSLVPARERDIPVHVLNSRNPEGAGTVISNSEPTQGFKGIAVKRGAIVVEATAERKISRGGFLKAVFDSLDRHGCIADVVATTDVSISVSTTSKSVVPDVVADLGKIGRVHHENSKAVVSLVGHKIPGDLPAQVFGALQGIPIRLSAHGASRLTFSFVINEPDVQVVVRRLHETIFAQMAKAVA